MSRPHDCVDFIDVRFHGADDYEGDTYCVACKSSYTESELEAMHEAQQREPVELGAAA